MTAFWSAREGLRGAHQKASRHNDKHARGGEQNEYGNRKKYCTLRNYARQMFALVEKSEENG